MAKRAWLVAIFLGLAAFLVWRQSQPQPSIALSRWTHVVAAVTPPSSLGWERLDAHPSVSEALQGVNPDPLLAALRDAGLDGLWVGVSDEAPSGLEQTLADRFSSGGVVRGFRGEALTPEGLLYVVDDTEWPVAIADRVLARVARGILEGSAPPPLEAFPEALTLSQAVEVLVMLSGGNGPRLWRSARAQSIADALVTASLAARQRWDERTEMMGGPLGERLDQLDIEVAFLFDDGTFDRRAVSLIDTLVKREHGVAYEQPSRWRYLLPSATRAAGSPTAAYKRLFRENDLPEDSFERRDLRLYRMRMQTVSIDQGSTGPKPADASSGSER
ncbi:MAG: hypothetical protein WCE62_14520 [Polyangiales bacterium]